MGVLEQCRVGRQSELVPCGVHGDTDRRDLRGVVVGHGISAVATMGRPAHRGPEAGRTADAPDRLLTHVDEFVNEMPLGDHENGDTLPPPGGRFIDYVSVSVPHHLLVSPVGVVLDFVT